MVSEELKFSRFQELVFPIHKHELKKFLPMSFLMFCTLFVYTLVRDLKDLFVQYNTTLWVGARPEETASLMSALKFWYVLPGAVIAVIVFTVLLNKFGPDKTFYITIMGFAAFYAVYGFIIYPNLNKLSFSEEQITHLTQRMPPFFKTFLTCLANWPITSFYVISELWGTMAIASLFWQFANRITMKHEVKRFFGLFSLLANAGTVIAGGTIINYAQNLNVHHVKVLISWVIAICLLIIFIYAYINKVVLKDVTLYNPKYIIKSKKSSKEKVTAFEGLRILFKNPYLLLISVLVISYGVAINFAEVLMKAGMKEAFNKATYAKMQGTLSVFTGIFASVIVIFSANILRRFSWKTSALITPLTFLVVGGGFLFVVLYKQFVGTTLFGVSAVILSAWVGIIHDALVKGVKYSLFDTTKSMTYMPLDEDTKTKGQAAVEIVGGRAGKAGASVIQQIMISFPRTLITVSGPIAGILAYSPVIVGIFFTTVAVWIFSVFKLSKKYESYIQKGTVC